MKLFGGTIHDVRQLYVHQLGAALKMENTVLAMLDDLHEHARSTELRDAIRMHHEETERHVRNVEQAFHALGEQPDDSPCPAIDGLQAEGKANLKLVEEPLRDAVALSAMAQTEHHEIAVYEELVMKAEAMDEQDVAALLRENLEQEEATLKVAQQLGLRLAQETAHTG
jgi:ferritin-like metal-binding protein YciE